MSLTVCVAASTLQLLDAGGHLWFYLNWILGLRALGCQVIWLEPVNAKATLPEIEAGIAGLKQRLAPFDLADRVAVAPPPALSLPPAIRDVCLDLDLAVDADLLLNLGNKLDPGTVARFRRSALVDIDPGIMQIWSSESGTPLPEHDVYFTTGETVGTPAARFPDCGVKWHYVPPVVYLPAWPPAPAVSSGAPYTTVSSWWGWWETHGGETFNNEKRTAFMEYVELPRHTHVSLELALALWGLRDSNEDVRMLEAHGWTVREAFDVGATPEQYRAYLSRSRGEFSCAKPSCMRLQNAWMSDRSICYMAMGKPAVVQHTGPSRILPDAEGLFRFRSFDDAVRALREIEANYEHHGRQARALVEEHFDAQRNMQRVLERALP